uniref:PerC family transcriptional regulator n=1 Tax=Serratia proteamaculans TaxID=28151 RepID=UPI001F4C4F34|nr:PerC family transcriptional regulator [Serratia proteamaculans]
MKARSKNLKPLEDSVASSLEEKALWRRAADRWLELAICERDWLRAEELVKRRVFCLRKSVRSKPKVKRAIMNENDRLHLDSCVKDLGGRPVSKYWIDYGD